MIRKTILLPVLLMLLLLCCARAETAPECIILGETQVSIDMANTRTHQLTASVLPAEADQTIVWTSSDRSVLTVEGITSADGRVFGKMGHSERSGNGLYVNVPGNKYQPIFEAGVEYFTA
mgnify:CR=1 FL=1